MRFLRDATQWALFIIVLFVFLNALVFRPEAFWFNVAITAIAILGLALLMWIFAERGSFASAETEEAPSTGVRQSRAAGTSLWRTARFTLTGMALFAVFWGALYATQRGVLVVAHGPLDIGGQEHLRCTYYTAGRVRSRTYRFDARAVEGRSSCPFILPLCEPAFASDGPDDAYGREDSNPLNQNEWDRCR